MKILYAFASLGYTYPGTAQLCSALVAWVKFTTQNGIFDANVEAVRPRPTPAAVNDSYYCIYLL
ncbi:unnamed protein product [Ceratitis capitata]|uniref:(Mediterranean fruit fly) hypothetical protein n=1 Tax=Ceratitis capitata TaxID=7213 RepID=A0A811UM04_CERCA|nr:unnamed protein product [Ceratitis capitata]